MHANKGIPLPSIEEISPLQAKHKLKEIMENIVRAYGTPMKDKDRHVIINRLYTQKRAYELIIENNEETKYINKLQEEESNQDHAEQYYDDELPESVEELEEEMNKITEKIKKLKDEEKITPATKNRYKEKMRNAC